jgi:hypothetical protein
MTAPILVQSTTFDAIGTFNGSTINSTSNFTAGNSVLLVFSGWQNGATTITIGGVSATKQLSFALASGDSCEVWLANNVGGGRKDTVINSSLNIYAVGVVHEVNFGTTNVGLVGSGSATSTDANPAATTSGATTVADAFGVACYADGSDPSGQTTGSPATGWTLSYAGSGGSGEGGAGAYKIVSATGVQSVTFTHPASIAWYTAIGFFANTSGGGGSTIDVTPSETLAMTDASINNLQYGRLISDTISTTDSNTTQTAFPPRYDVIVGKNKFLD